MSIQNNNQNRKTEETEIKLRKILGNLSEYVIVGLIIEERAEQGDPYAKILLENVKK